MIPLLIALTLTLQPNLAVSQPQPGTVETVKPGEVSFDFRAGVLAGCLEKEGYDPQRKKTLQNQRIAAFCLCYLEESVKIARVENSQVVFPEDDSFLVDRCRLKADDVFRSH